MTILASAEWRIRTDGNDANGGGYDSGIGGAATDYTDQAAAQASWTAELSTAGIGSQALTDDGANGLFTSAMIGNAIRISAGTNAVPGYYFIEAVADGDNVTIDRACDDGVGGLASGTGKLGGAFATFEGSITSSGPAITTPLAAGHTVHVRGDGSSDDPGSDDYSITGTQTLPDGNLTSGRIRYIGYDGRPRIGSNQGLIFFNEDYSSWEHFKLVAGGTGSGTAGLIAGGGSGGCILRDIYVDQNGHDVVGLRGLVVSDCRFTNSGSATAGTKYAILDANWCPLIYGNIIDGWKGGGIDMVNSSMVVVDRNVVVNCKGTSGGVIRYSNSTATRQSHIIGNTIDGNADDGIELATDDAVSGCSVMSNIITNNGGYGINCSVGTTALNDRLKGFVDHNFVKSNASGNYNAISAGTNDVTLTADPFLRSGDYNLNNTAGGGADVRAAGFPGTFPDDTNISYGDGGALQHQDVGGTTIIKKIRRTM